MRYLEALAQVQPKGEVIKRLHALRQSKTRQGRRYAKLNPLGEKDSQLFAAVLAGEHHIHGFRNKDIGRRLYGNPAPSKQEARGRSARVSPLIHKLGGHGLLRKVRNSFKYCVTRKSLQLMAAAIQTPNHVFPEAYARVGQKVHAQRAAFAK